MILPHPDGDLSLNIMVVGGEVVRLLGKRKQPVLVETVLESFLNRDRRRTPDLFMNCLAFLFAMGYVEHADYRIQLHQAPASPDQLSLLPEPT